MQEPVGSSRYPGAKGQPRGDGCSEPSGCPGATLDTHESTHNLDLTDTQELMGTQEPTGTQESMGTQKLMGTQSAWKCRS